MAAQGREDVHQKKRFFGGVAVGGILVSAGINFMKSIFLMIALSFFVAAVNPPDAGCSVMLDQKKDKDERKNPTGPPVVKDKGKQDKPKDPPRRDKKP